MSDDLFDDQLSDDTPEPPAPAPAKDKPAPAGNEAMDRLLGAVTQLTNEVRGISQRVAGLEKRPVDSQPAALPAKGAGQDVLAEMMADPDAFIEARAAKAVEGTLGKLAPFLDTVADSASGRARDRARAEIDGQWGDGVFDAVVGNELDTALKSLPAASRAREDHVRALAMGVFGGQINSPDGRKAFNEARKAARERPTPAALLTGASRLAPEKPSLTDEDRAAMDKFAEIGIPFSSEAYLDAKTRGDTEEAWGATWMSPNASIYGELDKPAAAKPNGAAQEA